MDSPNPPGPPRCRLRPENGTLGESRTPSRSWRTGALDIPLPGAAQGVAARGRDVDAADTLSDQSSKGAGRRCVDDVVAATCSPCARQDRSFRWRHPSPPALATPATGPTSPSCKQPPAASGLLLVEGYRLLRVRLALVEHKATGSGCRSTL